jgi:hypothetical protein
MMRPAPTGTMRKLHDLSLRTISSGLIPAGGWKLSVMCMMPIAMPTAITAAHGCGPATITIESPAAADKDASDKRTRLGRLGLRRAHDQNDRRREWNKSEWNRRALRDEFHDCNRDGAACCTGNDSDPWSVAHHGTITRSGVDNGSTAPPTYAVQRKGECAVGPCVAGESGRCADVLAARFQVGRSDIDIRMAERSCFFISETA